MFKSMFKESVFNKSVFKKSLFLFLSSIFISYSAQAQSLEEQGANKNLKRVLLSQYCFWSGEQKIGQIPGVSHTEAGFYDGHEVTSVLYDPSKTSLKKVFAKASSQDVAKNVYVNKEDLKAASSEIKNVKVFSAAGYRKAPESDQKKQLQGTPLENLEMSDFQKTKTNAFYRGNTSKALSYLSKEQLSKLPSRR